MTNLTNVSGGYYIIRSILVMMLLTTCSQLTLGQSADEVDSLLVEAKVALSNYNHTKAKDIATMALEYADQAGFQNRQFTARVILGDAARAERAYAEALDYYTQADINLGDRVSTEKLAVNERLGDLYLEWGLPEKSLEHYDYVLNSWSYGSASWIEVRKKLADAYVQLREKQWAIDLYYQILEWEERHSDYEGMLYTLKSLASLHLQLGQRAEALAVNLEILDIQERQESRESMATTMNTIGSLYNSSGQYDRALEYYNRAMVENSQLNNHAGMVSNMVNIASIYQHRGENDKALDVLEEAADVVRQHGNKVELAVMYNYLASVYRSLNNKRKALDYNQRAVAILEKSDNDRLLSNTYLKISQTYEGINNEKQALAYFKKYTQLKDSLNYREQLDQERQNMKQLLAETTERESKLAIVDQQMRSLELAKASADAEQARQAAELQLRESQLENVALQNTQLQNERQVQQLLIEQEQAETQKKDQEIQLLEQQQQLQQAELERTRLQDIDQERELELQRSRIALQNAELESSQGRQRLILTLALSFFAIMLLVLILFLIKRSDNLKLQERAAAIEKQKQEIERINENLIQLNEEKNDLLSIVAHDLKSPLNQIAGIMEIVKLTSGDISDEQRGYIETIDRSIGRMKTMVTQILDVNAIESKQLTAQLTEVDFETLLRETVQDFAALADRKNIILKTDISALPKVKADEQFVGEILQNLISNAVKYSPLGEEVHVRASHRKAIVRLEVSDNGEGINEHDMKKLFGKFHTLSARPTAGEDSTGLGLSIVKRYVDAMHGRVWCESEPGNGATFIVELPVA